MGTASELGKLRNDLQSFEALYMKCKKRGDAQFRDKIKNVISSLRGITRGHWDEVRRGYKHYRKGRVVLFKKYADLTIGASGDPFAKSIQLKSSCQTTPNDVDTYIAKAAYQISGGKKETPREDDRRVIDVSLYHKHNSWPFTPTELNSWDDTLAVLLDKCEERILTYVNENKASQQRGLTTAAIDWMTDIADLEDVLGRSITSSRSSQTGPRSTLIRLVSSSPANTERMMFNYITIKIRFDNETDVVLESSEASESSEDSEGAETPKDTLQVAIFVLLKVNDELRCEYIAYQLKKAGKKCFKLNPISL